MSAYHIHSNILDVEPKVWCNNCGKAEFLVPLRSFDYEQTEKTLKRIEEFKISHDGCEHKHCHLSCCEVC